MPEFPKISLVTTNYNYAQFLESTLLSVLDQNYPNLEYIVIDGGSTDESVPVIERHAARLNYWTSEPDAGQAHALNKGLRRCTGEIVGFLNSDDLHLPTTLFEIARMFSDDTVAWIGGPAETLDDAGRVSGVNPAAAPASEISWIDGVWFPQPSSFWRRSLMATHGYFEEHLYYCFDQEYWARLALAGHRPVLARSPLTRERLHRDRKTAKPSTRYTLERLFIACKFLPRLGPAAAAAIRKTIRRHERALLREPFYAAAAPRPATLLRTLFRHPDLLRDRQTWGLLKAYLFPRR